MLRLMTALWMGMFLVSSYSLHAQDEPPTPALLERLDKLRASALQLEAEGKLDEAISAMEQAERFAIDEQLDASLPGILIFLTTRRIRDSRLDAARNSTQRMREIDTAAFGPDYWRTRAWNAMLLYIDQLETLEDDARQQVILADAKLAQVNSLVLEGKAAEAILLAQGAFETIRQHLGDDSAEAVDARGKLGAALHAAGRSAEAESWLHLALKRYPEIYGTGHPSVPGLATALGQAIGLRAAGSEEAGQLDQALDLRRESVNVLRSHLEPWDTNLIDGRYELLRIQRQVKPIQQAIPAQLDSIVVCNDNFDGPLSTEYAFTPEVQVLDQRLHLHKGSLQRTVTLSSIAELSLDVDITNTLSAGTGFIRWGFLLGPDNIGTVMVLKQVTDGKVDSQLRVVQRVRNEQGVWQEFLVRELPVPVDVDNGTWTLRYSHGMLEVNHNKNHLGFAELNKVDDEPVAMVLLESFGLDGQVDNLTVSGEKAREWTEDEWHLNNACRALDNATGKALADARTGEAVQYQSQAARYRAVIFGDQSIEFARSCNFWAVALSQAGKSSSASQLYQDSLKICEPLLGDMHPLTATVLSNLGAALRLGNQPLRAIPYLKRALHSYEAIAGNNGLDTVNVAAHLSSAFEDVGELALAESYAKFALRVRLQVLGENRFETFASHSLLARYYLRRHDAASAAPLVKKAAQIFTNLYPEGHPNYALAYNLQAFYFFEEGDIEKSTEFALKAFELARQSLGVDESATREAGVLLEKIYEMDSKFPTSKQDVTRTIEQNQTLLNHQRLFRGEAHWLVKKTEMFVKTLEKLTELSNESYADFLQAIQPNTSRQLAMDGKLDLAIKEREESLATIEELLGKEDLVYVELLESVAYLKSKAQLLREPANALSEALSLLESLEFQEQPYYAKVLKDLAIIHSSGGLFENAKSMLDASQRIVDAKITDMDTYRTQMQGILDAYNDLSGQAFGKQDYNMSRASQSRELEISVGLYGEESWQARSVRWRIKRFAMLENLSAEAHAELKKTDEWNRQSEIAEKANDWKQVLELRSQELAIRQRILGENDESASRSRVSLAKALIHENQFIEAIQQLEIAVAARILNYGPDFPDLALSYSSLASATRQIGDVSSALKYERLAVAIWRKAEEKGIQYAASLNSLAALYAQTNDDASAASLFREAATVLRKTTGTESGEYAICMSNLATSYDALNDPRAETTFTEAVELIRNAFGEHHPEFAMMQSKDATRMERAGHDAKAAALYHSATETYQRVWGDDHLQTLINRGKLAGVQLRTGEPELAIGTLRQVTRRIGEIFGENHPSYAQYSMALARGLESTGQTEEAIELVNDALLRTRRQLDSTAGEQSERQQMLFYGSMLNRLGSLLTLTDGRADATETAYNQVMSWKGANFIRQRQRRLLADDPKLKPIMERLRAISRQLAALSYVAVEEEMAVVQQKMKAQLLSEQETLETELSRRAQQDNSVAGKEVVDSRSLQRSLPEGTALVDFFVYVHNPHSHDAEPVKAPGRRVVAFVTRHDQPTQRIDLGPADEMEVVIHDWRRMIVKGEGDLRGVRRIQADTQPTATGELPQFILRDKLWKPIAGELQGVDVVLLSLDGALNLVPFAALPSQDGKDYLLAEYKLAVIPVPQLIPALLREETVASPAEAMLLMIGDIDFGADPGSNTATQLTTSNLSSTRAGSTYFSQLPGTAKEIELIAAQFEGTSEHGRIHRLAKGQATETAIRQLAPQSSFMHFATHGFFSSASDPSDLSQGPDLVDPKRGANDDLEAEQAFPPEVFSGLAVAGANQGQSLAISGELSADDGILTATEVAELDLESVQLVVLSACETGLGKVTAGEGIMGLQRSFQVAGAQTVISSLWQVDDSATQTLMVEFYRNLLNKKLNKLEALRQAQLSLMRGQLGEPAFSRKNQLEPNGSDSVVAPRLWAPFVLSGDWR